MIVIRFIQTSQTVLRRNFYLFLFLFQISGYLNLFANFVDNFTHGLAIAGSYLVSQKVKGILFYFSKPGIFVTYPTQVVSVLLSNAKYVLFVFHLFLHLFIFLSQHFQQILFLALLEQTASLIKNQEKCFLILVHQHSLELIP